MATGKDYKQQQKEQKKLDKRFQKAEKKLDKDLEKGNISPDKYLRDKLKLAINCNQVTTRTKLQQQLDEKENQTVQLKKQYEQDQSAKKEDTATPHDTSPNNKPGLERKSSSESDESLRSDRNSSELSSSYGSPPRYPDLVSPQQAPAQGNARRRVRGPRPANLDSKFQNIVVAKADADEANAKLEQSTAKVEQSRNEAMEALRNYQDARQQYTSHRQDVLDRMSEETSKNLKRSAAKVGIPSK